MSFVASFYSFNIHLSNSDKKLTKQLRFKVPRHPNETLTYFYSRIIAFVHSWEEGLQFTQGLYCPAQPPIWKRNILEHPVKWIEVGIPPYKRIQAAIRTASLKSSLQQPSIKIYFYAPEQIISLNQDREYRNLELDRLARVDCHLIEQPIIEFLISHESSSSDWDVAIIDEAIYLDCQGAQIHFSLPHVTLI